MNQLNGHNETKHERTNKTKAKTCINSSIQVRTKVRKERNCTFCKQKSLEVTNCVRMISIENEVDPNNLIQFMEYFWPFKITGEKEIGIII